MIYIKISNKIGSYIGLKHPDSFLGTELFIFT